MMPETQRKWIYSVEDVEGEEFYVNENGEEVDEDDAIVHVATDAKALRESERRADLWERKESALACKVTRYSKWIVNA